MLECVAISFSIYVEYIVQNAGLDESQAGMKLTGGNQQPQACGWHSSLRSALCLQPLLPGGGSSAPAL